MIDGVVGGAEVTSLKKGGKWPQGDREAHYVCGQRDLKTRRGVVGFCCGGKMVYFGSGGRIGRFCFAEYICIALRNRV